MNSSRKKNLLLAFDAFGTLFVPKRSVAEQYAYLARRHGIDISRSAGQPTVAESFKTAYKHEAAANPNYGKAVGMGAEKWWANVITRTFTPYLKTGQDIPQPLINDLLERFSTDVGYTMPPDVRHFFAMLRKKRQNPESCTHWTWDRTLVGIITNSDDRVPSILDSFGLSVGPRRVGSKASRKEEVSEKDDISFVVLSYDVGWQKPDRRAFDAAVDMAEEVLQDEGAGVDVGEFEKLYVGDSVEEDYRAAKAAGWNACLLQRGKDMEGLGPGEVRKGERIRGLMQLERWRPEGAAREARSENARAGEFGES